LRTEARHYDIGRVNDKAIKEQCHHRAAGCTKGGSNGESAKVHEHSAKNKSNRPTKNQTNIEKHFERMREAMTK